MSLSQLLLLSGCSSFGPWEAIENDSVPPEDRIILSPTTLDFGLVSESATLSFSVYNLTDTEITLTGQDNPIGDPGFYVDAEPLLPIPAGSELEIPVVFTPPQDGKANARLQLLPLEKDLTLVADGSTPTISLGEPDISQTVAGCDRVGNLPITNNGRENLTIESTSFTSSEFTLASAPGTVFPGTTAFLEFLFTPEGPGQRGTSLQLHSNDPATPLVGTIISALSYEGSPVEEHFYYYPTNPTDILFLVAADSTTSANTEAAASYVAALRSNNIDYQLTALSGNSSCPSDLPAFSTRTDTSLQTSSLISQAFREGPGGYDSSLLSLALAALDQTDAGECLEGFRRADADLEIVLISGQEGSYTQQQLEQLGTAESMTRISGLLPVGCGQVDSYHTAVEETGGTLSDWCENWDEGMSDLAQFPSGSSPVQFPLADTPLVDTIEVLVEGISTSAWSYDEASNSILLEEVFALGSELTLRYVPTLSCYP
jgi:hypothetical protein